MAGSILYIDDERENLEIFEVIFSKSFKIYIADRAEVAFEILKNENIKIILSDYKMPDISGLEFCNKATQLYPGIVCMILTAYIDTEVTIKAINQGNIYRFLTKPWEKTEMTQALVNALEKYQLQQDNKNLIEALSSKNEELEAYNEELLATTNALKETNEVLEIAKIRAEESDRLKTAFLSNVSHEIRTPVNGISGFIHLLLEDDLTDDEKKNYTDVIRKCLDQLLRIINDIIDLSMIESGQIKIDNETINPSYLIIEILDLFQFKASEKNQLLIADENINNSIEIISDKIRLRQILSNITDNAIKFSAAGNINLGYYHQKNTIVFYVKDCGIGIPKDKHEVIFERFRQLEETNTREYGGNGLGLPIAKRLVEKLGGEIWLESTVKIGTTLFFSVPIESNKDNNNI